MDQVLVDKLGLKKNSKEYHRVLFTLTKPEEISTTLSEKRDVLREALKAKKQTSSLAKSAKRLSQKYGWMPVFVYGDPWGEEHYQKELEELVSRPEQELEDGYEKLENYSELRNKDIQDIIDKYSLSPQDLQVFIDFGLVLDARNEAEYVLSFGSYFLLPIYRETAKRLNLSIKQVRSLEENELASCLRGKSDAAKLLNDRREIFVWGFSEDMEEIYFYTEEEARKLFEHVEKHAEGIREEGDERGITASPGKVTGIAKLVPSPEDNAKVEKGDILITFATTVDYLPAMKKAAAFVAEVGGLTCHAAVVAREFGVPCIVSYPGAMSKFKDGEKIELDADNGVITKI